MLYGLKVRIISVKVARIPVEQLVAAKSEIIAIEYLGELCGALDGKESWQYINYLLRSLCASCLLTKSLFLSVSNISPAHLIRLILLTLNAASTTIPGPLLRLANIRSLSRALKTSRNTEL